MVDLESITDHNEETMLEEMIETHAERTGSPLAQEVLDNWDVVARQMVKIIPRDYSASCVSGRKNTQRPWPHRSSSEP